MDKTEARGFGYSLWKFMFYWFMITSLALMLVIYPLWLGWLSPRVYFGFIPIMTFMEWYVEIGFGISAYIWLTRYWEHRQDYDIKDLR